MYITNLVLHNFRNYDNQEFDFSENINIIHGDNGQGKTNILESLFLCACGRSHRTSRDDEMIKHGTGGYYVKLQNEKEVSSPELEIISNKRVKKIIRINGITVRKLGELMGNLRVVMFSPEDLMLIKEGPSERRRFIDVTLSQIKRSYFYELQQYMRILVQRNNLLKKISENKKLVDTLCIWDEGLVESGIRIMKERSLFVKKLNSYAKKRHELITGKKEIINMEYSPSIKIKEEAGGQQLKEYYKDKLKKNRDRELNAGTTLYGIQRDDLIISLNGSDIRQFGSQGQQRTAVLSLKLGEIDLFKNETSETPVLLLDDVMSELDRHRKEYLMDNLDDIQTFITTTDKEVKKKKKGIKVEYKEIKNGVLVKGP